MNSEEESSRMFELRAKEAEWWFQYFRDAMAFSKEYGQATIKSLITINGGAIIALLSFIAAIINSDLNAEKLVGHYSFYAFISFSIALILAIVAGAMGYLNFQYSVQNVPGPNGLSRYIQSEDISDWKNKKTALIVTSWIAVICAVFSGVFFVFGAFQCAKIIELVNL